MQTFYLIAGIIALTTCLVHSVLGEILIFSKLRNGGIVPTMAAPPLRGRHIRIIWASWHLVTVFGFALAGILLWWAFPQDGSSVDSFVVGAIVAANLAGAVIVLVATNGKHPGWIALLVVAVFAWFAASAL